MSPLFGHYSTIVEGISKLICYVAPPITAVFLMGVFWRKATARAAFATMVAGSGLGALVFALDFWKKELAALVTPGGLLDAAQNDAFERSAHRRQQQQDGQHIGEEPGGRHHAARHQDEQPIQQAL